MAVGQNEVTKLPNTSPLTPRALLDAVHIPSLWRIAAAKAVSRNLPFLPCLLENEEFGIGFFAFGSRGKDGLRSGRGCPRPRPFRSGLMYFMNGKLNPQGYRLENGVI